MPLCLNYIYCAIFDESLLLLFLKNVLPTWRTNDTAGVAGTVTTLIRYNDSFYVFKVIDYQVNINTWKTVLPFVIFFVQEHCRRRDSSLAEAETPVKNLFLKAYAKKLFPHCK